MIQTILNTCCSLSRSWKIQNCIWLTQLHSVQFFCSVVITLTLNFYISVMKANFKHYCEESSVHGLNYIVRNDLSTVEKCLWAFAFVISLFCCGFLIFETGAKLQEDSMVTYTSDKAISIVDVSFNWYSSNIHKIFDSDSIRCRHVLSWPHKPQWRLWFQPDCVSSEKQPSWHIKRDRKTVQLTFNSTILNLIDSFSF